MTQPDAIHAPWTQAQVDALNFYQTSGVFHPFTCGNRGDDQHNNYPGHDLGELVATTEGWRCRDCDYTQDWAHATMADLAAVKAAQDNLRDLGFPI